MAKVYESIKSLITPARIGTAATELGETGQKISAATDIVLPSLLACVLNKGADPDVEEVIIKAKKIKAHENYDDIWKGRGVDEHVNIGERMENRLLSLHSAKFNSTVGAKAGLRAGVADRLTNWTSATIAAWFSTHAHDENSYKALLAELAHEKPELRKGIPAEIIGELGLGHVLGEAAPHAAAHHPQHHTVAHKPAPAPANTCHHTRPPRKRSLAWLWWLLGIIALALIIFFCIRSCNAKKAATAANAALTAPIETVTEVKEVHNAPKFEGIPMVLPDGTKITMYKGHLEEAVKTYLDSDKFKNATEAELRSVWFEFTDIDFEHNTATELMEGSPERLVLLANLLKNYPDVSIKIGAFTDKTGNHAANYGISQKRAETIRQTIIAAGHPAGNVSIEGFGDKYAAAPADAPDAQRAPDRDVAMCFTK